MSSVGKYGDEMGFLAEVVGGMETDVLVGEHAVGMILRPERSATRKTPAADGGRYNSNSNGKDNGK